MEWDNWDESEERIAARKAKEPRIIHVHSTVVAPNGATHYAGELLEDPSWYKCTQVGVAGDHWWRWSKERNEWVLASHFKPNWLKEIV